MTNFLRAELEQEESHRLHPAEFSGKMERPKAKKVLTMGTVEGPAMDGRNEP